MPFSRHFVMVSHGDRVDHALTSVFKLVREESGTI